VNHSIVFKIGAFYEIPLLDRRCVTIEREEKNMEASCIFILAMEKG
jgi:hypothetical protein